VDIAKYSPSARSRRDTNAFARGGSCAIAVLLRDLKQSDRN